MLRPNDDILWTDRLINIKYKALWKRKLLIYTNIENIFLQLFIIKLSYFKWLVIAEAFHVKLITFDDVKNFFKAKYNTVEIWKCG